MQIGGIPFSRSRSISRRAWQSWATGLAQEWSGTKIRCTGLQPDTYADEQYEARAISSLPNPLHLTADRWRMLLNLKSLGWAAAGERQRYISKEIGTP